MKKIILASAVLLLIVLILLPGCSDSGKINELQSQVRQQQEKIASLASDSQQQKIEISDLQTNADQLKGERDDLTSKMTGFYSTITVLDSEIQSLTNDKNALNSQLLQAQKEIDTLKSTTPQSVSTLSAQIASLVTQLGQLQTQKDRLNVEVASLTQQLTASPNHALTWTQITTDPDLRSTAWTGKDYQWHDKIKEIGRIYHSSHVYIADETDCDDMSVDIWNMLLAQNIKSVIVIGNLENKNATFTEANHAWLVVYNFEGKYAILEPTTGEVIYGVNVDGTHNTRIDPYYSGWAYKKPSDLWQDVKKKW